MKNYGFTLGAAILLAALCFEGCSNPALGRGSSASNQGVAEVSLAGSSSRTLFPDMDLTYKIMCAPIEGGDVIVNDDSWNGENPQSITLSEGLWVIRVVGRTAVNGVIVEVCEGSKEIAIHAEQATPAEIILVPIQEAGRNGFFLYDAGENYANFVTGIPAADIISAKLTLTSLWSSDPSSAIVIDLFETPSNNMPLPAGYYVVTAKFVTNSNRVASKSEAVHIYREITTNLNTSHVFPFENNDFSAENPLLGDDPGDGPERVPVFTVTFDSAIDGWSVADRASDGRIHTEGDIAWENAFGDGKLKLSLNFDGVPNPGAPEDQSWSLDGVPMKAGLPSPIDLTGATFIQFDFYYPMNSQGKLMRFELWSTTTGGEGNRGSGSRRTQAYIRPDNLEYLNGPVAGEYRGQAFRVKKITMRTPVTTGIWEDLRLDIHGESATSWSEGVLFIDNLTVLQQAPGDPIPPANNANPGRDLPSVKEKYNNMFLIGTTSPGANGYNGITGSSALLLKHFNTVTPGNSLKADSVHPNPPQWLIEGTGYEFSGNPSGPEYTLTSQDAEFGAAQENGYKMHGHVLAWFNQGARWMTQIVPENITSTGYNAAGNYFSYGNGASGPFYPVSKGLSRRAYYNHILYELRHFMTTDSRYTDNTGIIGFHSFDVLNEEIHETRHTAIIPAAPEEWKTTLRNTSWLRAMTGDDYGDITQHYVYLLFKFAHIAVPNAQMAVKYRANYASLPDWMKQDNHDDAGSIDGFISPNPPILYYNDYDLYQGTKAKAAYNMIRELNIAWQNDPLYDGRPLIEGLGIQGHDTVGPALANQNRETIRLFAGLIDQGLLTTIAISELDLVIPDGAPGGAASSTNGDILNQKQADAIGYQYALLFKVYIEFSRYIERITLWGTQDPGWGGSYKPFDSASNAAPAYYGIMDPDRFIAGHSYLDAYFDPLD